MEKAEGRVCSSLEEVVDRFEVEEIEKMVMLAVLFVFVVDSSFVVLRAREPEAY